MPEIVYTGKMKRDVKPMKKRGKDRSKLIAVLELLANREPMPANYRHQLTGNLNDFRECHIEWDWLLIYQIFDDKRIRSVRAHIQICSASKVNSQNFKRRGVNAEGKPHDQH